MKSFIAIITLGLLGLVAAQSGCENQADPDEGIGNYCYCSSTNACYAEGSNGCNPPGGEISCP